MRLMKLGISKASREEVCVIPWVSQEIWILASGKEKFLEFPIFTAITISELSLRSEVAIDVTSVKIDRPHA